MTVVLDKEIVKDTLRELITEEPDTFKKLLKEVLSEEPLNEDEEFEQLIKKNLTRFEATFKALA